jgi:hypothetical protein
MNTSRKLITGVVLAGLTFAVPARAEVAAETNVFGNYLRTVVYASASVRHPRIWSVTRMRLGLTPLNPQGDATGDLFPVVAENPAQQGWPLAVWSRFNGHDYDLVWSRWEGRSWSPVATVEASLSPFDAIDPVIAFNAKGRAHMVWMNQDDSSSAVYLSVFESGQWMSPYRVSDPGEIAIRPGIEVSGRRQRARQLRHADPARRQDDRLRGADDDHRRSEPLRATATTTTSTTTDLDGSAVNDKK